MGRLSDARFRQHPTREPRKRCDLYEALREKVRTRLEVSLGMGEAIKQASRDSEGFQARLTKYAEQILDMHLAEMATLRERRFKPFTRAAFVRGPKAHLQVLLKYSLIIVCRRLVWPDVILQQELVSDLFDLAWQLLVLVSKGNLEEARKIVPYLPLKSIAEANRSGEISKEAILLEDEGGGNGSGGGSGGGGGGVAAMLRGESLDGLRKMAERVLKEDLQTGRNTMLFNHAGEWCARVAACMAPRGQQLLSHKFRHY